MTPKNIKNHSSTFSKEELALMDEARFFPLLVPYYCEIHNELEFATFRGVSNYEIDGETEVVGYYNTPDGFTLSHKTIFPLIDNSQTQKFWDTYSKYRDYQNL